MRLIFFLKKKKRHVSIRYQDKLRKGASLDRSNFKKACPVLPLVPGYSAAKGLSWMVMPGWKQFFLGRWMWACTGSISITSVSYTHLTLPTTGSLCRSRWSPYH